MKDKVIPIEELERLFQERRRFLTTRENYEHDIKNLERQLAEKEELLIAVNDTLAGLEAAIKTMAGQL